MCVYFVNLKYVVKTTICVPSNTTSIAERCYEIPFSDPNDPNVVFDIVNEVVVPVYHSTQQLAIHWRNIVQRDHHSRFRKMLYFEKNMFYKTAFKYL